MTIGQAHEIFEEAKVKARETRHYKAFTGYTEDEIARGTAAVLVVLREEPQAEKECRPKMSLEEFEELFHMLGLFGENKKRILEVYSIVADIIGRNIEGKTHATA